MRFKVVVAALALLASPVAAQDPEVERLRAELARGKIDVTVTDRQDD